MANQKRSLRLRDRKTSKIAYVKRYDARPDFSFPDDFDLASFDLLLIESIRGPSHMTILLYWRSEDRCRANEPLIEKQLGITNQRVLGDVVQVLIPPKPKWTERPERWGSWLLSAAALFGALTVIRDNFTELFEPPDITVFVADSASLNYHAGDPLAIPLKVRNQARGGKAEVHISSVSLKPLDAQGSPKALQSDISQVRQLQPDQNADVHVSGTAPDSVDQPPQRYALEVKADAKEGYFLPMKPAAYRPFTVTVWSRRYWSFEVSRMSANVAQVRIIFSSGVSVPKGRDGSLIFASASGLQVKDLYPYADEVASQSSNIDNRDSGSVAKVEFSTDPLQPFTRYSYSFALVFTRSLTRQEWKSLPSWIRVEF